MATKRIQIFKQYLWVALFVVLVRAVFRFTFGGLTIDALLTGIWDGLKLSLWVVGIGLLNVIFDFSKLARLFPGKFGTALAIAVNLVPEQIESVKRIRFASGLRSSRKGIKLWQSLTAPVLADSVDRAITLASSMESRGFSHLKKSDSALDFKNLTFSYKSNHPVLSNIDFKVVPGECVLISGPIGSGKSTLLKLGNGLAPHFTGGISNQSISAPGSRARHIGYVDQQPAKTFVAATVWDELAYFPKQLGFTDLETSDSVSYWAEQLELTELLQKDPRTLSAGWSQRVAIAAALTGKASIVLLDEPVSNLDKAARKMVLAALMKLKAAGVALVIAEHDASFLSELVDRRISLGTKNLTNLRITRSVSKTIERFTFEPVTLSFDGTSLFENLQVSIRVGTVNTLVGANGCGKTSLLKELSKQGATLVPQPASDLLFLKTVGDELKQADFDSGMPAGSSAASLSELGIELDETAAPQDLSVGQKLALAIAIQVSRSHDVLMLDEPTVGFDENAKAKLARLLFEITKKGKSVLVATHDEEFAKAISDSTQRLESGVLIEL